MEFVGQLSIICVIFLIFNYNDCFQKAVKFSRCSDKRPSLFYTHFAAISDNQLVFVFFVMRFLVSMRHVVSSHMHCVSGLVSKFRTVVNRV